MAKFHKPGGTAFTKFTFNNPPAQPGYTPPPPGTPNSDPRVRTAPVISYVQILPYENIPPVPPQDYQIPPGQWCMNSTPGDNDMNLASIQPVLPGPGQNIAIPGGWTDVFQMVVLVFAMDSAPYLQYGSNQVGMYLATTPGPNVNAASAVCTYSLGDAGPVLTMQFYDESGNEIATNTVLTSW